jgi:hypothetical protein
MGFKPRLDDEQVAFWRALMAPFPPEALSEKPGRGGKPMTWLDKRSLANRLDEVCGPHGWTIKYTPTQRGFIGTAGIECPMGDGEWKWVYKDDGAGFEEMDAVDDDEKSGYTNAFRRAFQDAWGIGRYLYRKGIPDFLIGNDRPADERRPEPRPEPERRPEPETVRRFEYADIPRPGNGVYPWFKEVEKHFHDQLWGGAKADATSRGWNGVASTWDKGQVDTLVSNVIRYIKTLGHYKGEFDGTPLIEDGGKDGVGLEGVPDGKSEAIAANLKAKKAELGRRVKALVEKQLGKPGAEADIVAVLKSLATCSANDAGAIGIVLPSLKECQDGAWIDNMLKAADDQMRLAVTKNPSSEDDDVPF